MTFYKNNEEALWYEMNKEGKTISSYPFGYFTILAINTLNALKNKDSFATLENEWLINAEKEFLLKSGIIKNIDEEVTIDKLSSWYDNNIDKEHIKEWYPEYKQLTLWLEALLKGKIEREIENGIEIDINDNKTKWDIYENFKFFPSVVFRNNTLFDYIYEHQSNERIKKWDNDVMKNFVSFSGHGMLSGTETPCEIWEVKEIHDIFILDFWEILFNKKAIKPKKCHNCGTFYYSKSGKSKYCECCKKNMGKIEYKRRMSNPITRLEKLILDYGYRTKGNCATNDWTNEFLKESKYHKDIIAGKQCENNPEYASGIKTENDYIKWLENKFEEAKKIE